MTEPRPRELILATLTTDAAGLADAAFDWLTANADDPRAWDLVSQLELQTFLWYSLPMKWMTENREHHEVAWALGDFFRAAGKPRFAEICRAQHTHLLIDLWDADSPRARAEYNRLLDQSGVHPPDTRSLTWGSLMGLTEAFAFSIVSDALEDAIDAGTLTPGGRGWRRRAVAVAEAALARPYREDPEFSLAGAVRRERREQWVNHVRGRGLDLPQAVADAVTTPSAEDLADGTGTAGDGVLEAVVASLEPLVWLLREIGDGVTLTQAGNLPRALVLAADERYDWFDLKPKFRVRTMWDLFELGELHELVTAKRWVTKRGRKLSLSAKGRTLLADPQALTGAVLGHVFDQSNWYGDGALAAAVVLLGSDTPVTTDELYARLLPYLGSHWATEAGPVRNRNQLAGVTRRLDSLGSAFGWLAPLPPRSFLLHRPLTEVGRVACLSGLRHVASGPWLRM